MNSPAPNRFIQIDREGYFLSEEVRVSDKDYGKSLLQNLSISENGSFHTKSEDLDVIVEAFDDPLVVSQVDLKEVPTLIFPYDYRQQLNFESLSVDEWDRFHGLTSNNIPFVFSRKAQATFFNELESFTDESVTFKGKTYTPKQFYIPSEPAGGSEFWTGHYDRKEVPWDLSKVAPALEDGLAQLKLTKSRVLVPGAGRGHDAQYFASKSHIVTAVDFSEAAKKDFEQLNPGSSVQYVADDFFHFAKTHSQGFDLIFDHTFFCAINPEKRNELIRAWHGSLITGGFLLAIFFVVNSPSGPPFGATEWEIEQRLKKYFKPLYWSRCKTSIERRLGKELLVYAQKI